MTVQLSRLPGGGAHRADIRGSFREAVDLVMGHYHSHKPSGGYIGLAPIGRGIAVQLHDHAGRIISWRILVPARRTFLP